MKKYIFLALITFLIFPFFVFAWDDCPRGEVNDPYPGDCGLYVDTNNNGICDRSEPEPIAVQNTEGNIVKNDLEQNNTIVNSEPASSSQPKKGSFLNNYNSLYLSGLIIFIYLSGLLLVKLKKIRLITHRKIWNIILLFSFLGSGLLGLLMAYLIDQGISISWHKIILWLHVEFGITMAIISIFHALWHAKYYLSIIKSKA